jgi:hypothetical protein
MAFRANAKLVGAFFGVAVTCGMLVFTTYG